MQNDIKDHLMACSKYFIPSLETTVSIDIYSDKIYHHATKFEAWEKDKLVGLVACYFNNLQDRTGFITNVSVLKTYTGRGLAKQLIIMCLNYGLKNQFNAISLEVNKLNLPAINLYMSLGFEVRQNSEANVIFVREFN